MLVFGAMTLADTKSFYLEKEEIVEGREIEREELKEGAEGKDSIKLLISGGTDYLAAHHTIGLQRTLEYHTQEMSLRNTEFQKKSIPLFIMHCCLKVHLF